MKKEHNIAPTSTRWLSQEDYTVADYFWGLGFHNLQEILDEYLDNTYSV